VKTHTHTHTHSPNMQHGVIGTLRSLCDQIGHTHVIGNSKVAIHSVYFRASNFGGNCVHARVRASIPHHVAGLGARGHRGKVQEPGTHIANGGVGETGAGCGLPGIPRQGRPHQGGARPTHKVHTELARDAIVSNVHLCEGTRGRGGVWPTLTVIDRGGVGGTRLPSGAGVLGLVPLSARAVVVRVAGAAACLWGVCAGRG